MVEDVINGQINLWEDKDFLQKPDMRLDEYELGNVTPQPGKRCNRKLN
jgi:hypothetical protein